MSEHASTPAPAPAPPRAPAGPVVLDGAAAALRPAPAPRERDAEFLAAVQREFRFVVHRLQHDIDRLGEFAPSPEAGAAAREALEATRTIAALTRELLDFSRLLSDQPVPRPVAFRLDASIEPLRARHAAEAKEGGSSFEVSMDPLVPQHVEGDASRLRQVLDLMMRAVAAEAGGGAARLVVCRADEDDARARIDFTAVAPRARAAIPAPPATDGDGELEGSEIPPRPASVHLHAAARFAAAIGGEVTMRAAGGDEVSCTLRLWLGKAGPRKEVGAPKDVAGRRVLLAAPSGPARVSLQMALRAMDCRHEAVDGVAAALRALQTAALRHEAFDAVLFDLGLDADRFAAELRGLDGVAETPVVVIADVGVPGDADWATAAGFDAYLVKPVKAEDLRGALARVLRDPAAPGRAAAPAPLVTAHSLREEERPPLRVLVVDDDRVHRLVVRAALERMGHRVVEAGDGAEGMEAFGRETFDAVVLDVRMPDMDGDQVAVMMRARERGRPGRPARILCVTAQHSADDRERCVAAGADDFLLKPLDPMRLSALLEGGDAPAADAPLPPDPAAAEPTGPAAAAEIASDAPPIDLASLERVSLGIPALRAEMLEMLNIQVEAGLGLLEHAAHAGDHGAARSAADLLHSLATSGGAVTFAGRVAPFAAAGGWEMAELAKALPTLRAEAALLQQVAHRLDAAA